MKRSLFVIAAVLVLAPASLASGEEPNQETSRTVRCPCMTYAAINGRSLWLEIPIDELEESPWTPESAEEPPVSLGEASRAAITEFNRYMSDRDDWVLYEIALRKICQASSDNWGYMALWSLKDTSRIGTVTVVVLMSGRVISLDGLAAQNRPKSR